MTLALVARGLTRRFGDRLAVDGLDLEVAPGEALGFLGPNGAGKTTTVRLFCGLVAPTSGEAWVSGLDVKAHPDEVRAKVGVLTETPGLWERLTVLRNLQTYAELYGLADPARSIERWLSEFGLWDRRFDPAGSLSKGLRQRVAIARALLHEPPVLFLDEPTAGLDPEAARQVRDAILTLKGLGRTVFLCTHNLDEAERICDRVAIFRTRLLAIDRPSELRARLYGRELVVHLAEVTDAHLALVRSLEGVDDAVLGEGRIVARVSDTRVVTPRIVRALVGVGADVLQVGEVKRSLEQLYLDLVGQDGDPG